MAAPTESPPAPSAPLQGTGYLVLNDKAENLLPLLGDNTIDAIITDPPYELGFMGKGWDSSGIAYSVELWAECLRVLKPGGHLASFGGSRTYHRMACAIEDAGFEIRDSLQWLYGSGFPKSHDVSKAIDKAAGAERKVIGQHASPAGNKPGGASLNMSVVGMPTAADITAPATDAARAWQGWGTALKPSQEPIVLARKPLAGTVAQNVLAHGVGGLNIDGCRVAHASADDLATSQSKNPGRDDSVTSEVYGAGRPQQSVNSEGRWPSNVLLSHGESCNGECALGCPVAELDAQSGILTTGRKAPGVTASRGRSAGLMGETVPGAVSAHEASSGGASRFFPTFRYQAKAPTKERPKVGGIAHPTVKPLALMQWLVRLLTPPGGLLLDPFAGSGTTIQAALAEDMRAIGFELDATHIPLIAARLGHEPSQP